MPPKAKDPKPKTKAKAKPAAIKKEKSQKTRGKRASTTKTEELSDADSDGEVREDEDEQGAKINWNADGLSEKLITAIIDNPDIKQGLFPAPGANVSTIKGGGKRKTFWQRKLAEILFSEHPGFTQAYARSQKEKSAKKQGVWGDRVRNRITKMISMTRAYIIEMGTTGEGITSADEIDMNLDNPFVNKWKKIEQDCPWFWDMRNLIAERPNLVPAGVGNSASAMDMSVLDGAELKLPSNILHDAITDELDESEPEDFPKSEDISTTTGDDDIFSKSDSPEAPAPPAPPAKEKRKAISEDTSDKKKRPPKKTKLEEFSAAAQAEEMTRQKELELASTKIQAAAQVEVAKEKTKADARNCKKEERLMKAQMKMEKMKMMHEMNMARYRNPDPLTAHIPTPLIPTNAEASGSGLHSAPVGNATGPFRFAELGDHLDGYRPATIHNTYLPDVPRNHSE